MRSLLAAVVFIGVVPTALLGGEDNPFKNAKLGDWVDYKMIGPDIGGTTKMTIVAKDDKEVIYEIASTFSFMGKEMKAPLQTIKVDLTKDYDAISAANLKRTGTTIEKVGEGAEKIKFGEKQLETRWHKLKCTTVVNDFTIVSEFKMWFCKEVPVSGLVRMETTVGASITNLELVGYGSK
jgi:hypothetical protein